MNKLLYLSDDEVQSQLATKYNLLVNIGLDTFQYAIIDHARDQIKVLAEFEIPEVNSIAGLIKAIEELPESGRQFKFSFNRVKISFDTSNYTFIPADLYVEENRQDYGKYLSLTGTKEILVNNIPSAEIKNVVAIETQLSDALHRIFQKPKIFNQATPFLEGIQKTLNREDDLVCFIDVHPRHFQVGLLKDFKLEFYNSFEYANADEFNYYLLKLIESLALQIEETPIMLSGKISKTDEIYQRIEKYFDSIRFIDSEHFRKYSDQFEEVLPHTFFTLISLDLCE
jgi:hypothetical protein